MNTRSTAPTAELIQRLAAIVGPAHALTDPRAQLSHLREWRELYAGRTAIVLKPGSVEEVSRILALAHAHEAAVVPQGGNTGLVGGQTPMHGEILLCLSRLARVRAVDAAGYTMTVEAGVTLAEAQAAAERVDRHFPLSLPSEGSCQIGGNLATNAGGAGVLAYGSARQLVLGLEVVLADGRIWGGLKALKKDNSGYDLKDLFIGSEGTLGVITAAVLKLFPRPAEKATAFVAIGGLHHALALFNLARDTAGQGLTAFEFMPRIALDFVLKHIPGARDPFAAAHPWYVLLETSGLKADGTAERLLIDALAAADEEGTTEDVVLARSLAQARDFWRLRDSFSLAQKGEGGNIKNDISVPIAAIPDFVARAEATVLGLCPGARPLAVGHFGDGNVHYNIAQPIGMPKAEFLARWEELAGCVDGVALAFGGSISAEHGIGQLKRGALARVKPAVELELMRALKTALDPKGILNPGKIL
jgi:FAD/FMN-containing dehydrogenase